ncbi:ATP-grasp domain-containing protein [Occultella kanbiaonis]|uniref:ATP-grasp domain-containing protein n=1 Tax=Occultella kanbiaonis TaxID=2675754 RepID=UPI001F350321|nr:ATP-grasp domain-containing protein [Occultella kanbiaonis]
MRVLVTGVGGPAGWSLAEQLTARGISVLGADMVPIHLDGISTVVVPPASDPAMLRTLRSLVTRYGISLVIPTVSEELPGIAAEATGFGPGVEVVVGSPAAVATAHDKLLTAEHLLAHGVPVPAFAPADEDAAATLGRPVIVKPRVSRGGRGVRLVEAGDTVNWADLRETHVVQEFAPGIEFAPVVHRATLDDEPHVIVLEKTELAGGRIGNAVGVRAVPDGAGDVAAVARDAVVALGLVGPVDLDIRLRADGTPVVLEVNARFGANSAAAPELLERVLAAHTVRRRKPFWPVNA